MAVVQIALYYCVEIIEFLIIIRCVISWLPIGSNKIIEILYAITEPILGPVRRLLGNLFGGGMMIDFSPIVAFLVLDLIQRIIFML